MRCRFSHLAIRHPSSRVIHRRGTRNLAQLITAHYPVVMMVATIRGTSSRSVGRLMGSGLVSDAERTAGRTREQAMVSGAASSDPRWVKSSSSGADGCLELANSANGGVLLRSSRDPGGPELEFTVREVIAFEAGLAAGDFDAVLGRRRVGLGRRLWRALQRMARR